MIVNKKMENWNEFYLSIQGRINIAVLVQKIWLFYKIIETFTIREFIILITQKMVLKGKKL
jgi:hypothetical protein